MHSALARTLVLYRQCGTDADLLRPMNLRHCRPILLAIAVAATLLLAAVPAGSAHVAGHEDGRLHFRGVLTRLSGDKLMYRTWADGYFESLLVELRRPGYRVTSSVLTSEDGERTNATPSTSPCYPAPSGYFPHHGAVECPSLLYQSNGHTGVHSLTIIFTTSRCYPRWGGIVGGASGPSTPCKS